MSLSDVEYYLLTQWERCLEDGVQLPAKFIKTYSGEGHMLQMKQYPIPTVNTHYEPHSDVTLHFIKDDWTMGQWGFPDNSNGTTEFPMSASSENGANELYVSPSQPGLVPPAASENGTTHLSVSPSQPGLVPPATSENGATELYVSPSQPGLVPPAASENGTTDLSVSPSQPGLVPPAASENGTAELSVSPSQPGLVPPAASANGTTELSVSPSQPGLVPPAASANGTTHLSVSPSQPGLVPPAASANGTTEFPVSPSQLSSLSKCIFSVLPGEMKEVVAFDTLKSKIKSKYRHRALPRKYQEVSFSLRNKLIQQYQKEVNRMLHSKIQDKHIQHRLNVIKRVLKHEWNVTLS